MSKQARMEYGFSLIELTLAVVILSLVAAIGYPSFRVWIENTRIRNSAESILSGLQLARAEAVKRNAQVQFTIGDTANWTIGCVNPVGDLNEDGEDDCPALIQERTTTGDQSESVLVETSEEPPYIFNSLGRVSPAPGGDFLVVDVDMDEGVLSADESRELRINIGVGGDIKMCDPNVDGEDDLRKCPE
jgi:type IV fimbrial biogenesis protein FimT